MDLTDEDKRRLVDHLQDTANPHLIQFPILKGSAELNFGSINAGATAELTLTVTGAVTGQPVALSSASSVEAGLIWCGYVSAANTVTVRMYNTTGAPIDPAAATWTALVFSP